MKCFPFLPFLDVISIATLETTRFPHITLADTYDDESLVILLKLVGWFGKAQMNAIIISYEHCCCINTNVSMEKKKFALDFVVSSRVLENLLSPGQQPPFVLI